MFKKFINYNFGSGNNYELEIRNLLRCLGFTASTTGNDDRGVDIIAEADLGDQKKKFLIQCKFHNKAIGLEPIQEVYTGASLRNNEGYPVVITNNRVTHAARKAAMKLGVEIIADLEWQELQDCYTTQTIPDNTRFGLMGIMLGASICDYEHIQLSSNDLPTEPQNTELEPVAREKLDHRKRVTKEKFDEALLCEQEADALNRKASHLRQISLALQKEATLDCLEYG